MDNAGSFSSSLAHTVNTLYFPLVNESLISSITPLLRGDCKAGQQHFLLEPVSRIDLALSRASRNFWVCLHPHPVWSATGVSKEKRLSAADKCSLKAGLLWQEVTRRNHRAGLEAAILSFVPSGGEPVEIMQITLTNISRRTLKLTPTAAIPLYARGAGNIRDHRHVTSLLQRITLHPNGVITTPTLEFNEEGHKPNRMSYFVFAWDEIGGRPAAVFPTQEMFCGESGDLEAPQAVYQDLPAVKEYIDGKEPMGAVRFAQVTLKPKQKRSYIVVMGLSEDAGRIPRLAAAFRSPAKVRAALVKTRRYWLGVSRQVQMESGEQEFDNWFHWVSIQPTLRRICGCSFLPDFDYGKGGRGWRDLWQDCLGLILSAPEGVRRLLINNFAGVRIDGTNATIIGKRSGEFIADRNNISRVWMDHGIWPLLTMVLYLNETGDKRVLFEQAGYFHDGDRVRTRSGRAYHGTLLEHLLVQTLVPFFKVGAHNCIRLEGADWNDGLDMAPDKGESAAFTSFYAHNLDLLAGIILDAGRKRIACLQEIRALVNAPHDASAAAKRKILAQYHERVRFHLSGRKIMLESSALAARLRRKAEWLRRHLRRQEWLSTGFFNGYYDNLGRRVEGRQGPKVRMMLASQVFPVLSGVADEGQLARIVVSVDRYLRDKQTGGIRLNTDFGSQQHQLGRAFSFVYGDKENGAYFNHMTIMYAYALYSRGYVHEGWRVLRSIFDMARDTAISRIYPCVPEYYDSRGRGMYSYLTGSGSWFVLTLLTMVFGVRGDKGDLLLEPKLDVSQFRHTQALTIKRTFAGRVLRVTYVNRAGVPYGKYRIRRVTLNGKLLALASAHPAVIPRRVITALARARTHALRVELGL